MIIFHIYEPELQKGKQNLKQTVEIKMKDKNERSELVKIKAERTHAQIFGHHLFASVLI